MFSSNAGSSSANNPAPSRPSLFNKPTWIKAQTKTATPVETAVDYFDRKRQSLEEIEVEDRQRRERKRAKREQQRSEQLRDKDEHAGKRRRVDENDEYDSRSENSLDSFEYNGNLEGSREKSPEPIKVNKVQHVENVESPQHNPSTPDPAKENTELPEPGKATIQDVLVLSDEENNRPSEMADEPEPAESDDEFREIAQRARDLARKRQLEREAVPSTVEGPPSTTQTSGRAGSLADNPRYQQTTVPEPVVSIMIVSRLENTQPLVVKRRLKQRLGMVREYWCNRQGFGEDDSNQVFLTWNGIRLHDFTSCRTLGIDVDEDGNIIYKGQRQYWDDVEQKIVMEAMTDEILEEYRKAREMMNGDEQITLQEDQEQHTSFEEAPQKESTSTLKVVLKAKGFDDFKLKIKKTTTVAKMLGAFSIDQNVPPDRKIFLMFEGDKLDPEQTAEALELEDMESLEVHFQ